MLGLTRRCHTASPDGDTLGLLGWTTFSDLLVLHSKALGDSRIEYEYRRNARVRSPQPAELVVLVFGVARHALTSQLREHAFVQSRAFDDGLETNLKVALVVGDLLFGEIECFGDLFVAPAADDH